MLFCQLTVSRTTEKKALQFSDAEADFLNKSWRLTSALDVT